MVQSAKKERIPSLAAASTMRAVMAPWMSVSQTTGMPLSFSRALVLEKAQELGYVIESRARPDKQGMIQLVIYKRHGKVFSDTPFFEQLIEGAAEKASALGYHLSISYFYGS